MSPKIGLPTNDLGFLYFQLNRMTENIVEVYLFRAHDRGIYRKIINEQFVSFLGDPISCEIKEFVLRALKNPAFW